jgi:hypothetical protein
VVQPSAVVVQVVAQVLNSLLQGATVFGALNVAFHSLHEGAEVLFCETEIVYILDKKRVPLFAYAVLVILEYFPQCSSSLRVFLEKVEAVFFGRVKNIW